MKKSNMIIFSLLLIIAMAFTACGNETSGNGAAEANTIGTKFEAAFMAMDIESAGQAADSLIASVDTDLDLVPMEVSEGYLNGFTAEITGFNSGVMFSPMIGSIPFVAYVFETDNAKTLEESLKANADLRWNICTEADEMVSAVNGNYVFFIMCSNEEM